ncbi:MAG TPA: flagella basal body P-ring formation protein FlgA [Planctomycetota bacterium]
MILAAIVLISSGELTLKESARVQGRYVRLADLLRSGHAPADVWLGRAPEEGKTRVIAADDIRRELELRGYDLPLVGDQVVVERGPEPESEALRRAVAFEIKRAVLERDGLRGDEVAVRLESLSPAPTADVRDARPEGNGFVVTFADGTTSRATATVDRLRDVAFAVREIPAGRTLTAEDVEFRRAADGASDVIGATTAVRVKAGAALGDADLKRKPVVRRGDVVRLTSAAYEVDARALEDGAVGREIDVEIAASKVRARGRVAAAGRVEAK